MTVRVYCIKDFKKNFNRLLKNNSYRNLERLIIDYFFNKTIENLKTGSNLNQSEETPFIKKRIPDSRGFRFYFLLLIKKDSVYLTFVHPKTGSLGFENLSPDSINELLKKTYNCIKNKDIFEVSFNKANGKLRFFDVK